ncbi:MAG: thioredoxin domain-containing protein [Patescibacteria group bacterium]
MNKSKLSINILIVLSLVVLLILAISVFSFSRKTKTYDFPEVSRQSPTLGDKKAKIQIIEFGDFECPFCAELAVSFNKLKEEYKEDIRIVWKDFPIYSIHAQAMTAAEVARCSQKQGKFWEMHDKIFENQRNLSSDLYVVLAEEIGLDIDRFASCVNNHETIKLIEADINEGTGLGVNGTPHFYVNQYVFTELPTYEQLKKIINEELIK